LPGLGQKSGGSDAMKNWVALVLAILIAWILWNLLSSLIVKLFSLLFFLGMIALFCAVVYGLYKMMTREKNVI
jgi:hypothetical protein